MDDHSQREQLRAQVELALEPLRADIGDAAHSLLALQPSSGGVGFNGLAPWCATHVNSSVQRRATIEGAAERIEGGLLQVLPKMPKTGTSARLTSAARKLQEAIAHLRALRTAVRLGASEADLHLHQAQRAWRQGRHSLFKLRPRLALGGAERDIPLSALPVDPGG